VAPSSPVTTRYGRSSGGPGRMEHCRAVR
jgi:hypothetical protein